VSLERELHDKLDDLENTAFDTKGQAVRLGDIFPEVTAGMRAVLRMHYDNHGECAVCRDDDGDSFMYPCPTVYTLSDNLQVITRN